MITIILNLYSRKYANLNGNYPIAANNIVHHIYIHSHTHTHTHTLTHTHTYTHTHTHTHTHTCRRVYLSVAAAAIYMASQASEVKKTQKGSYCPYMSECVLNVCTVWYKVIV